jgi:uncharacterized protein YjbI with pentapeptide repeats
MSAIVAQTGEPDLLPLVTSTSTKTPKQIAGADSPELSTPIKEQIMSAEELINRYQAGERDFKEIKLVRAGLKGVDLSEADLSVADLAGADLSAANLSGANLSGAILKGANLTGADLTGADLSWADLGMANLTEADLTGANMNMTILIRTRFKNTTMPDGSKR